jgi:ABC-2 type transport system permease protein
MRVIGALALKDLRLLLRDKAGFFFTFFFPLIVAVLFGTIFGGGDHTSAIPVIIVDEDGSAESRAFVDTLVASPELRVAISTRQLAAESVRRGKIAAYVVIKPGFGEASRRVFWGSPPGVELGVDPARRADAGMLEGVLMKYASKRFQDFFSDPSAQRRNLERAMRSLKEAGRVPAKDSRDLEMLFGALDRYYATRPESSAAPGGAQPEGANFEPIAIDRTDVNVMHTGPTSAYAISFPQGIIWGLIAVTAAFSLSIVGERTKGTLLRLEVAPIGRWQILAGKALACFVTAVSVSAGLLILAYFGFGVHPSSIPMLVMAVISSAMGFVGLMMLLSVLGKTQEAASGIGWAVLLIFSMLGGGMVPYFIMPSWMRTLSHLSPVKWSILAMEGAIWRRFTVAEMVLPCGILLGAGLVFFAVGVRAFSWSSEK